MTAGAEVDVGGEVGADVIVGSVVVALAWANGAPMQPSRIAATMIRWGIQALTLALAFSGSKLGTLCCNQRARVVIRDQ